MKTGGTTFWMFGAIAAVVSLVVVAMGLLQQRIPARSDDRIALGKPLTEQQILARRRGAIGTVAVGGATAQ